MNIANLDFKTANLVVLAVSLAIGTTSRPPGASSRSAATGTSSVNTNPTMPPAGSH